MSDVGSESRLKLIRRYTLPKVDYRNEDFAAASDRKGIYALSDGASISYDSANWARILAISYVQSPIVTPQWIENAIEKFSALHNREAMAWMAQAAFDRGSFASLLGIRVYSLPETIEIFAVGDTAVALCDGDSIVSASAQKSLQ